MSRWHLRTTVECFGFLGIFQTMTPLRSSIGSSSPSDPDSTIRSYRSTLMRKTSSGAGKGQEHADFVAVSVGMVSASNSEGLVVRRLPATLLNRKSVCTA
jgi:hypothetical protein